jgi:hypothetical protein
MSLGKRKRTDDDDDEKPVNTSCKRRKVFATNPSHFCLHRSYTINLFSVMFVTTTMKNKAIPHSNSNSHIPAPKPSLLFRLPAELRTQILHYAYGNQTVHFQPTHPFCATPLQLPPLVNRKFYAEATAAFYASSAFSFADPRSMRTFALSSHACVSRLERLEIPWLTSQWCEVPVSSLVGQFKSLRAVKLTHRYWQCAPKRPVPGAGDAEWKGFWRMIRALRQFRLDKRQSEFKIEVYNAYKPTRVPGAVVDENLLRPGEKYYEDVLRLEKDFMEGLLEYTPRRFSERVAGKERVRLIGT